MARPITTDIIVNDKGQVIVKGWKEYVQKALGEVERSSHRTAAGVESISSSFRGLIGLTAAFISGRAMVHFFKDCIRGSDEAAVTMERFSASIVDLKASFGNLIAVGAGGFLGGLADEIRALTRMIDGMTSSLREFRQTHESMTFAAGPEGGMNLDLLEPEERGGVNRRRMATLYEGLIYPRKAAAPVAAGPSKEELDYMAWWADVGGGAGLAARASYLIGTGAEQGLADLQNTLAQAAAEFRTYSEEIGRSAEEALAAEMGYTEEFASEMQFATEQARRQVETDWAAAAGVLSSSLGTLATVGMQSQGKMFQLGKAFAIAQAIINTYEGATKALAIGGPFGIPLMATVIAAGMAQVAMIQSQSPPARAFGGPVWPGQPYLVGERGPELFTPRSAGAITANDRLGAGGIVMHRPLTVNIAGTNLSQDQITAAVIAGIRKGDRALIAAIRKTR